MKNKNKQGLNDWLEVQVKEDSVESIKQSANKRV